MGRWNKGLHNKRPVFPNGHKQIKPWKKNHSFKRRYVLIKAGWSIKPIRTFTLFFFFPFFFLTFFPMMFFSVCISNILLWCFSDIRLSLPKPWNNLSVYSTDWLLSAIIGWNTLKLDLLKMEISVVFLLHISICRAKLLSGPLLRSSGLNLALVRSELAASHYSKLGLLLLLRSLFSSALDWTCPSGFAEPPGVLFFGLPNWNSQFEILLGPAKTIR